MLQKIGEVYMDPRRIYSLRTKFNAESGVWQIIANGNIVIDCRAEESEAKEALAGYAAEVTEESK